MGGKTKQRTKNNARPSSSGRSAELLCGVKLDSGIVNVAGTQLPALFPSLVAPSVDPLLPPELQLCLKKLTKKDPITKAKALQELSELVNSSKVEDVVCALPSWTHFYRILSADPDRKVRECTQACHGSMVSVCGRRVAPHLKQLMPAWLGAQSDEHAPAQAHALTSLTKTFPDTKLSEVLSFCKDEVVTHLVEVLAGDGELAHIRKSESAEEREAGAARAASRSLHALQYLVTHLPAPLSPWLEEALRPLLGAAVYWQRAMHPEPRIRAAWFGTMGSIVSRFKAEFGAQYGAKTLQVLVGGQESNPLVAAQLWDCLLLFIHNVPDWHQYLAKKELFSKRILDVLESGGWGDARHLSNVLLPLLAGLPEEMHTRHFHDAFFNAMFRGLDKKPILSSKSERQFWITSLEECLRYLSTQSQPYVVDITSAVHRTWLEKLLTDTERPSSEHLIKYSASSMVNLLKYWLEQVKQRNNEKYEKLIRNFWRNVGLTLTAQIDKLSLDHNVIHKVMAVHILLLKTFKSTFTQELNQQHSVRFKAETKITEEKSPTEIPPTGLVEIDQACRSYNYNLRESAQRNYEEIESPSKKPTPTETRPTEDPDENDRFKRELNELIKSVCASFSKFAVEEQSPTETRPKDMAVIDRYKHSLDKLAQNICGHYFQFAIKKQISGPILSPLRILLMEFDSEHLYLGIASRFKCRSVFQLYNRVLSEWLKDDTMQCISVVAILFLMMKHMTMQQEEAVFNSFKQFHPSVVEWCIAVSLSTSRCDQTWTEQRWARGALVAQTVRALCARALLPPHLPQDQLLLFRCLDHYGTEECVVSTACVQEAVQQVSSSLREVEDAALEERSKLAVKLTTVVAPGYRAPLLAALLSLTTTLQCGDPRLSTETWSDAYSMWQHGVGVLPERGRHAFLQDAAAMMRDQLHLHSNVADDVTPKTDSSAISQDSSCSLEMDKISHVMLVCGALLRSLKQLDKQELRRFTAAIVDVAPIDPVLLYAYSARHLILTEKLNCPFEDDAVIEAIINETLTELSKDDLVAHLTSCLFRVAYLRTLLLHRLDDSSDNSWCNELLQDSYFEDELVKCIHDYAVICGLHEGYAFWPHYKLIEQSKIRLDALLGDIANETNTENREKILSSLKDLTISNGYFWAYARRYYSDLIKVEHSQDKTESIQGETECDLNETDCSQSATENGQGDAEISVHETDRNTGTESVESLDLQEESLDQLLAENLTESLLDIITGPTLLHILHFLQAHTSSDPADVLRTKYYLALADLYLAHLDEPPVRSALLHHVEQQPALCPDVIINVYHAHNHTMLRDMDVSGAPWRQILSNSSICSFLASYMLRHGWDADSHNWDFANITLCSLLTSVELSKRNWGTTKVSLLCCAVLRLLGAVRGVVRAVPAQCERSVPSAHVAALPREWDDIYAPDINRNLFSIILHVLECCGDTSVGSSHAAVLDALVGGAALLQWERLDAELRSDRFALWRIVDVCTATLKEPAHSAFKYLAYAVLKMMLKPLVLEDAEKLSAWSLAAGAAEDDAEEDDEEEEDDAEEGEGGVPLVLSLLYYDDAFFHLQEIVETAVAHVRVCEEVCSMAPFTDSHSLALGWLLLAELLHQQCALARGDLMHQYLQIYRERKYTEPLLRTALRLLPGEVLAQAGGSDRSAACEDMFTAEPRLDIYKRCGSDAVRRGACRAVWACVRGAGAGATRSWRGAAHHRHAQLLDNITSRYITPHVVKEEFALIQKKGSEIEDTEITINWSAYEVTCVLRVDDSPIELVVSLARQHPLVLPRLAAAHHAAGNINWILLYLGYQNGTILSALKLWTVSVNNKMERAPQCYVCYCRLHHATGRLPTVYCHTCKNKFHDECLRKWFLTSSKMTCPLCRANF